MTARLDPIAAAGIERLWQALAERLGADDSLQLGYHPHVTLAVLPDTAPVAPIDAAVARLATIWTVQPVTLAGLGVFPGTPPVLWAAPVPTSGLLAWHSELHAALTSLPVHPHYRPGAWMPHVTLAKEAHWPAERLLEAALSAWDGKLQGSLDRIDLVRFRPVAILRSEPLAPAPDQPAPA
ncbi:MAG: 2'-5' RNA ligase family protein [Proteobacteria bacterium]|nr:2'-5' RNA ligase family protein [Pseudomonadota bacterium]